MRLAGAMVIHQGIQPEFAELAINDLARHVDALFILANGEPTPAAVRAAQRCPKLAAYARTNVEYNNRTPIKIGRSLHAQLFALLDEAKPEMVLYPDADELLPPNIEEIIDLMENDGAHAKAQSRQDVADERPLKQQTQSGKAAADGIAIEHSAIGNRESAICVEFPVLVCAGDAGHVIRNVSIHAQYHGPHVTLAVWRPGIKLDSRCGFNYPGDDYVGRSIRSPWPKRHLYVATPAAWRQRYQFKPQPWMVQPWTVAPYDPKRTWDEWLKQEKKP
jgi:hypothetical protein